MNEYGANAEKAKRPVYVYNVIQSRKKFFKSANFSHSSVF